jgi:4-amino-4-deoxy-L-arabinose transferase-like glycosyltransferase
MNKLLNFFKKHSELICILILLLITGVAHSYNMFHYPYYENDEGTYMSQAWAVITHGKLAPYTYWYDHSPVGWLLISLWTVLTGGIFSFGFSLDSGRVFMLVLHLASTFFLFKIAKKISGSLLAGVIACLLFALSPLGLSFERRILLDNIMIFWVLLSYFFLLGEKRKLMHYAFSAVSLGLAILSKESAIFFIPMFILAIVTRSHEKHRLFSITYWTVVLGFIVSSYFLFALLKGEFFPSGTFLGGDKPHVSLVETFQFQLSRKGGFFLGENSGFMVNFKGWVTGQASIPVPDPVLIIAGIASTLGLLLSAFWKRRLLLAALPALSYSFFLIRGGEVITFYVIPLIPLFGLTVGVLISYIYKLLAQRGIRGKFLGILFVILSLFPFGYYYARHTEPTA